MDYRERKRLEDEINRGTLNVGIHKLEEGAYERESRLPVVVGGTVGLSLGGSVAVGYGRGVGVLGMSPLGLFSDDYVLVMLGIVVAGMVLGALIASGLSKIVPTRKKSAKGASGAAAKGKPGALTDSS